MRVSSPKDVQKLRKSGADQKGGAGLSNWAANQIEAALATEGKKSAAGTDKKTAKATGKGKTKVLSGESPGEASVRLALMAAFGDWQRGGEVVAELMPFRTRRFRCDFALPRWRYYIEVDGWSHHGEFLEDHHSDRERGLFFSSHDWLPFRVSHDQAINNPGMLVDAIAAAMQFRNPISRESLELETIPHKHGVWYRLQVLG